jgi:hypothetical protein
MKSLIQYFHRVLFILSISLVLSFSQSVFAQDCFNCDGDKTTCGQLGCDFQCEDCDGPDVPVDNGVWLLMSAGGLVMLYFAAKKFRQVQSTSAV